MFSIGVAVALAATTVLGIVALKEFTKKKPSVSIQPLYDNDRVTQICPYLVLLTYVLDEDPDSTVPGLGFIVESDEENSVVWGLSWFLYETQPYITNGKKVLRKGTIHVNLQNPEYFEKSCEGVLVDIDYEMDVLAIKFRNPDRKKLPTATLASTLFPYMEPFVYSVDMVYFLMEYRAFKYDFVQNQRQCGIYAHIDTREFEPVSGICLNSQLEVIGLKIGACDDDSKVAHVLQIDKVSDRLLSSSIRPATLDIRFFGDDIEDQTVHIDKESWWRELLWIVKGRIMMKLLKVLRIISAIGELFSEGI